MTDQNSPSSNPEESINLLDQTLPTKTIENPVPPPTLPLETQTFDPTSPTSPKLFPVWGKILLIISIFIILVIGVYAIIIGVPGV